MAKVIAEFTDHRTRGGKYPWAEWLDGQIWRLERGVDFTCSLTLIRQKIYQQSLQHGGSATVAKLVSDGKEYVEFQFLPKK
jgi:uncharacterized protein YlaN (UPF0358 family)